MSKAVQENDSRRQEYWYQNAVLSLFPALFMGAKHDVHNSDGMVDRVS